MMVINKPVVAFGFKSLMSKIVKCCCLTDNSLLFCSYLPWFEVFYKLLNNLADYLSKGQVRIQYKIQTGTFQVCWIWQVLSCVHRPVRQRLCCVSSTSSRYHRSRDRSVTLSMVNLCHDPRSHFKLYGCVTVCGSCFCVIFFSWGRTAFGQHRGVPLCWAPRGSRGGESDWSFEQQIN